jgi:HEAT repeat protein
MKKPSLATTLADLQAEANPTRASLQGLSGLSASQVAQVGAVWPALPLGRRRWLVETLVEMAEDNVELDLVSLLVLAQGDEDPGVRRAAVEGLWESEDVAVADALLALLATDPDESVRAVAAGGLGNFTYLIEMVELPEDAAQRVREGLLAAIRGDASFEVRRRAVEAIGFLSADEEVQGIIAAAYADQHPKMRTSAVFAMGRNCDLRWLPQVLAELTSDDPEMRFEAARACGELEDRRVVPRLARLVLDEDMEVRLATIEALGKIGGSQATEVLRHLKESEVPAVADAAADALAESEFAESPLVTTLEESLGLNQEELARLSRLRDLEHAHNHDHDHDHDDHDHDHDHVHHDYSHSHEHDVDEEEDEV